MMMDLKDGLLVHDVGTSFRRRLKHVLMALPEDKGQSLIEFALVVPIFLMIVLGIFSFGIAFNNWEVMTEAANVGGRVLAISRNGTLDPCHDAVQAIESAAPTLVPANLTFSFNFNGVAYSGVSCASASTSSGASGNLVQGQTAQLNVTYPCNLVIYKTNYASSCVLHAQTTELVQ